MKPAYRDDFIISLSVFVVDWIAFNAALLLCYALGWYSCTSADCPMYVHAIIFNISYLASIGIIRITLHHRWSSLATILANVFGVSLLTLLINAAILGMAHLPVPGFLRSLTIFAAIFVLLAVVRAAERKTIKYMRFLGRNTIRAIIIGNEQTAEGVIKVMSDQWNGYRLLGLFYDQELGLPQSPQHDAAAELPKQNTTNATIPRLGLFDDAEQWLKDNVVDEVYVCLRREYTRKVRSIVRLCNNKMIRVFYVPQGEIRYKRNMHLRDFGNTHVLAEYNEPLMNGLARVVKRTFDICFSALFLCTLFPILLIIVTIVTKITMPGPVFFRQRRTGYDGKEFWCYKFRSMKVNNQADTVQATKDDDRVTRWGKILRHTNIDEMPQFWNVFIGDMSVVGPRPHMLAHTDYYSEKISDYMVRHYVRPGVTGWAQTHGERGQTDTVHDMERRVECDIWYIEHWSFWLDLQIIIMTIIQIFTGDDKAY